MIRPIPNVPMTKSMQRDVHRRPNQKVRVTIPNDDAPVRGLGLIPGRYVLWGVALASEYSLPVMFRRFHAAIPVSTSHVPERFALFTIIVLGETIVAVALGTAGSDWALASAFAGTFGFLAAAALWWIYFGTGAGLEMRPTTRAILVFTQFLSSAVNDRDQLDRAFRRLTIEQRSVLVFHYYVGPSKPDDLGLLRRENLFHVQLCDVADVPRELAADAHLQVLSAGVQHAGAFDGVGITICCSGAAVGTVSEFTAFHFSTSCRASRSTSLGAVMTASS